MDVPFISSGALSRAHYALVRNVEEAKSTQAIQQRLLDEITSIRHRLTTQALSMENIQESLVILLYCFLTLPSLENHNLFDFALPHAMNLAEVGRGVPQKRIGYLFCAEVMSPEHELQLMLVNTLRKDLEDGRPSQICLALDNIIMSPSEDLIPAIDSRLHDLLSHNSSAASLMAFRSLSRHHPELLTRISRQIVLRLDDNDSSVVNAALMSSALLPELSGAVGGEIRERFSKILKSSALLHPSSHPVSDHRILTLLSSTASLVDFSEENVSILWKLTKSRYSLAQRRGAFLALKAVSQESLLSLARSRRVSLVEGIRPLLVSADPNEVSFFLNCLDCLDPIVWAGSTPEIPAALDGWEVEWIMHLLESRDNSIRRMTLRILTKIDVQIVASYYTQTINAIPQGLSVTNMNESALRFLEILEVQFSEDGESYGHGLTEVLGKLQQTSDSHSLILEKALDRILSYIHEASLPFRIGSVTTLLAFVADVTTDLSQTSMVIAAALAVEYSGQISVSPIETVRGFSSRLSGCIPSVQEACILAMLRVIVECDELPSSVLVSVEELKNQAGRHLRRRCELFSSLVNQKDTLRNLVRSWKPTSLPEFLAALETHPNQSPSVKPVRLEERSPSRSRLAASQLRYRAYDRPVLAPKLRDRESSSQSESSSYSGARPDSRASSVASSSMMRTLTPGELTLVVGTGELVHIEESLSNLSVQPSSALEASPSRADLIALDSPFASETDISEAEVDFEAQWNRLEGGDSRGWQGSSVDNVVRRMQQLSAVSLRIISSDDGPFQGDLKVIITLKDEGKKGLLRLRETEDNSCLWRLRCDNKALEDSLKQKLETV